MSDATKRAGTFEVKTTPEGAPDMRDGLTFAKMRFDKVFSGPLKATSVVQMSAVMTPEQGSAGYVATERIEGELDGRAGTFCVLHLGLMDRGAESLVLHIVPGSGTGALSGLRGTMSIRNVDGQHHYEITSSQ